MYSLRASRLLRRWRRNVVVGTALSLWALGPRTGWAEEKISFQEHVRPIFESACNNCHNADKKKGGLDLTSYAALMAGGSSGEVVAPGAASDSRLFACIARTAEPVMPPQGDPVPPDQLEVIRKWIDGGVIDAKGGTAKKAKKPSFSAQVGEVSLGRPEGPPPMPEHLVLEPVVVTPRAGAAGALASSPWAPLVALAGQQQVLLYQTDTLELAGVLPVEEGAVDSLIFSRNGQMVIAGAGRAGKNGRLQAWDVKTGNVAFVLGEERDSVLAADVSADLRRAALGGPLRRVKLYDPASGDLVKDIKKHTDWVTAVQFSPDGVLFASGDRAGGLYIWEAGTGNEFYTLAGHTKAITAVTWRADGNLLASASEDGTVRLWEMNEGKEVKKWDAHGGGVLALAFTHDGRLVSCGRDYHAKVWAADGSLQSSQNKFHDLPLSVTFTHDGQRYVVGDWSGRVSVWNTADGQLVGELSAAPPSIAQRLAALQPQLEKAQEAAGQAKASVATASQQLSLAQEKAAAARQHAEAMAQQLGSVGQRLSRVRATAEALLGTLEKPQEVEADASAVAEAPVLAVPEEASGNPQAGRAELGSLWPQVAAGALEVLKAWPAVYTTQKKRIQERDDAVTHWQEQVASAQQALASAEAEVARHEQELGKWQAAQANVQVVQQRRQVEVLTARLEEAAAAVAEAEQAATSTVDGGGAEHKSATSLQQLREEYAALEAQLAEARQQLDERTQVFLSRLPK